MAWCVAVGCKSRSGILGDNNELIYFHYFPKDIKLRNQWIKNVRRGDAWKPNKYSRLCSLHFEKSCFQNGVVDKSLLGHAVPTIFNELPQLAKNKKLPITDKPLSPKKTKPTEQTLNSPCRTEFKKYEKLLMMVPYYERCRCCLKLKNLQNMWQEHVYVGNREVYGEMLVECFAVNLQQPAEHIEQICVSCIARLRAAYTFRNRVLETDRLINRQLSNSLINVNSQTNVEDNINETEIIKVQEDKDQYNTETEIQEDYIQESTESEQEDHIQESTQNEQEDCIQENTESLQEDCFQENTETQERNKFTIKIKAHNSEGNIENEVNFNQNNGDNEESTASREENLEQIVSPRSKDDDGAEYLDLEFLEDDESGVVGNEEPAKKPLRKKKLKQIAVTRTYARENLNKCVQAVKKKMMTRDLTSARFTAPLKLGEKRKLTVEEKDAREQARMTRIKLIREIKTILTYTNATPYKTKVGKYFCAYCTTVGPSFEDPNVLREHTTSKHTKERTLAVYEFMKPAPHNEVLKLDIEALTCVVCGVPISSWNDMFNHLNEKHGIELDEAYIKVIPYKLDELKCVLCNEKFQSYHILNNHMNVHYNSYKCKECGLTFLSERRLKTHTGKHSNRTFQCEYCPKVFLQDEYRQKHVAFVHNKKAKYKCRFCPDSFYREYPRHLHMLKNHRIKSDNYSCELCGKGFNWRPYYLTHMRLQHRKREKEHKCKLCDKKFKMAYQLKNHENWHKGTRDCVCSVCGRKFVSKQYLKKHYKSHSADKVLS